jgi:hypothetical protein
MHATYAFLISVPESFSLKGKAEQASDVFLRDYAETDNTDENNWFEICGIITKDGESYNCLDGLSDWRGREVIVREFTKDKDKDDIWNGLIDFSYESLRHSISTLLGLWAEGSETVPSCKKELIGFLDKHIEETKSSGRVWWMRRLEGEDKDNTDIIRQEVDRHIEHIEIVKKCIISSRLGCFSRTITTPYDYRCFDLRDAAETEKAQDVVLLVDIHT